MRARQLQCQDNDLEEVTFYLQYICLKGKEWHNLKHNICDKKLAIESIILLHNTRRKKDMSCKLSFK